MMSLIRMSCWTMANPSGRRLSTVKDFPGVTGLIRFDEQGDSQTPLRFFEIEDGEIDAADVEALAKGRQG